MDNEFMLRQYQFPSEQHYPDVYVGSAYGGLSITPAVPEPATLVLLGTGLAAVAARRWRQRKQV